MRALVTGISGFAGSHLAEHLLSKRDNVYGLVRPDEDLTNLSSFLDHITLKKGDLTDQNSMNRVLAEVEPDIIFHLAAEASAHKSFQQPLLFFEINVLGTVRLFEAIKTNKLSPRTVLVTSSEIYGYVTPQEIPISEGTPFRPESPYAVTKVSVHYLGYQYFHNYGLQIVEARAFNHIGPRQALGFVVPDFCAQISDIVASGKEALVRVGNLEERRDFVDVRDVVRAYRMLAERGTAGAAYNICSGKSHKIRTVLEYLIEISGEKIKIEIDPQKMRPARMPEIRGNNHKIVDEIGWQPLYNLKKSLGEILSTWTKR